LISGCESAFIIMSKLKSIEENFFSVGRYWGSLNSSLVRIGCLRAMHTGVPISDFNWAWNEKPLTGQDAAFVENVKNYYKQNNLRFWWWVYPRGNSAHTSSTLENAGMKLIAHIPCMAANLDIKALDEKMPVQITMTEVKDDINLLLWADISFRGFHMSERVREQYNAFVLSFGRGAPSAQKLFIACMDGKPAATSLLFMNSGTAGIYYVSTLPEYRNKGLGFYVTLAAMRAAKDAGYGEVILQATPDGEKVYRRIGFIEYCKAQIYKPDRFKN